MLWKEREKVIMAKIIVLGAMKGGVGKSVSTHNLAYSLKKLGKNVLVVDFDSSANITRCVVEDIKIVEVFSFISSASFGLFGLAMALVWHSSLNSAHHLEMLALETPYSVGASFLQMETDKLFLKFLCVTLWHNKYLFSF